MLRLLLKKWSERVHSTKGGDFENVWDKQSARPEEDKKVESVPETPVVEKASNAGGAETGVIGEQKKAIDFTMEELFRRLRRIEKLTRMIRQDGDGQLPIRERGGSLPRGVAGPLSSTVALDFSSDIGGSQAAGGTDLKYAKVHPAGDMA